MVAEQFLRFLGIRRILRAVEKYGLWNTIGDKQRDVIQRSR